MSLYVGRMRTSKLNDREIHPTEYRKWSDAQRHFRYSSRDRKTMAELAESIPRDGLLKPVILGVSDRYPDVYVADGHHRAVTLINLGIWTFSFHWYWIRSFGVRMETEPFPYHLLNMEGPA